MGKKRCGLLLVLAALVPVAGVGAQEDAAKPAAESAARVAALSADEVPAVPYDAGSSYRLLVPSSATGGQYAVIELVEGPGYDTPWHRHDTMEERYYVVEGTLTLRSAEGTRDYPAGSYAVIPPGAVHAQGNNSDRPVKLLLTLTPGGFEAFFEDRAELAKTVKRGDPQFQERMIELAGRHGRWLQPANAPAGADAAPAARIGGERDRQGCLPSAGYRWCDRSARCERPWQLARAQGFENTAEAFANYCRTPTPR